LEEAWLGVEGLASAGFVKPLTAAQKAEWTKLSADLHIVFNPTSTITT